MAKVRPRNQVRFAWWGAEESGLVGSTYYVNNLSEEEQEEITLYLNFDMIGSPTTSSSSTMETTLMAWALVLGRQVRPRSKRPLKSTSIRLANRSRAPTSQGARTMGPFIAVGIPSGGLFTGAEGIKTPEEAAIWGGTAGIQYDPCYHLACDTYDNINLHALDVNSDAVAYAVLQYAMNTEEINGCARQGQLQAVPRQFGRGSSGCRIKNIRISASM
jgi:Zn-dependent M28 family amino/carboxypeptidase